MAQEDGQLTTCREIAGWASFYLGEHIDDKRKRQIAVHLAICAGCETYVKQIATVRDVVGLLPKVIEQPCNWTRLRQAFAAQARRSSSAS
jgi:hypothetical protein